jgi:peptide/nickel transport system permease protein
MLVYALKRLAMLVPVLLGMSLIVFGIISLLPGDPAQAILGSYATEENVARLNRQLGLDQPLPVQYWNWLTGVLQGDFGRSFALNRPVAAELAERFPPTLILAGAALVLCALFGTLAGVVAAVGQYTWTDKLVTLVVLIGISTPSFFLGILMILVFSVWMGVFPTGGMYSLFGSQGLLDLLHHLTLPAITLSVVATGVIARLARANMLEVLRQDYVRTARAKGLRERSVILKHAFKNALVTIIPVIGIQAGFVLGGAVYIESVFQWPGIGRMLVNAISQRDILLVQGGVLIVAAAYVIINLITDLAQASLDPRVRQA